MSIAEHSAQNPAEEPVWFAMSATFGRELKAKALLESKDVTCFVPMRYELVGDKKLGKKRKLKPAIHNLIFVFATKSDIQTLKAGIEYLHYLTQPCNGRNIPIIVPEEQMRQFITVCNTYDEKLEYVTAEEIDFEEGTPVKIIGSAFDGVEGTFVKVDKSGRKKRVVVMVKGIAAVMLAKLSDGYLQPLPQ